MRLVPILSAVLLIACFDIDPDDQDGDGVEAADDCNDFDSSVYPGAEEICDGQRNNCNDRRWVNDHGAWMDEHEGDGPVEVTDDWDDYYSTGPAEWSPTAENTTLYLCERENYPWYLTITVDESIRSLAIRGYEYEGMGGTYSPSVMTGWHDTVISGTLADDGLLTLDGIRVATGIASGSGGNLSLEGGKLFLYDVAFDAGEAGAFGGSIYTKDTAVSGEGVLIEHSEAGQNGGAAFFDGGSVVLADVTVTDSVAGFGGGGLHFEGVDAELSDCSFEDNTSQDSGGAVTLEGTSTLALSDCTLSGNAAGEGGGGIFAFDDASLAATDVHFSSNEASGPGFGDHVLLRGELTCDDCEFSGVTSDDIYVGPDLFQGYSFSGTTDVRCDTTSGCTEGTL